MKYTYFVQVSICELYQITFCLNKNVTIYVTIYIHVFINLTIHVLCIEYTFIVCYDL